MKMGEGEEWAFHSRPHLSWWPPGRAVPAAKLAAFDDLPAAYLNKKLKALARAGIVSSTSGLRGGFQLARSLAEITLLDVVVAIEGPDEAFRCEQLLKRGPSVDPELDYRHACLISQAMRLADLARWWELALKKLLGLRSNVERRYPAARGHTLNRFAALSA